MDNYSRELLTWFSNRKSLTVLQLSAILNIDYQDLVDPLNTLRSMGYTRFEPNHRLLHAIDPNGPLPVDAPLEITFSGRSALSVENERLSDKHREDVRYWITTGIAALALVLSIISIALQYL